MTRRALAYGEVLIDEYPDRRVVAGAPLHAAAHLASFGWAAAVVTRLGDDADGALIRRTAAAQGVDLSLVETDPELPTGTVTITFTGHGAHSFTIHRPAAWDAIAGPDPVPPHDVLHYGTLGMRSAKMK